MCARHLKTSEQTFPTVQLHADLYENSSSNKTSGTFSEKFSLNFLEQISVARQKLGQVSDDIWTEQYVRKHWSFNGGILLINILHTTSDSCNTKGQRLHKINSYFRQRRVWERGGNPNICQEFKEDHKSGEERRRREEENLIKPHHHS